MAENSKLTEAQPSADYSPNPIDQLYSGFSENTYFKSPLVSDSYRPPYNSDDLWQKRGSYAIYESMVQDDQVNVCLRLKKDLILGEGGQFTPEDEGQDEMIEELKTVFFEDYEGDFQKDIEEILTSYDFGFSLSEKIFKLREGSRLGLKKIITRHPNSWRIYQDLKGKVEKFEQVTAVGDLDIDPKSLIHFVNDSKFQNPYGTSDLRAAYNAYFTKTQVVRYMGIFLEKAASPIPVGKYDKNAPQGAVDKLFDVLKKFQTKTAITIPKDIDIQFLEAKNSGDAYIKAIHLFNMFIGRALFIPDLLGFTGSETGGGSLALGEKQMNLFFLHVMRRRAALENVINKELVWPVIAYNYGFVKNYPKFRFKPLDDMKAVEMAKVWLEAVKGKAYKPNDEEINHFRKLVKFPEGDVELLELQAQEPIDAPSVEGDESSGEGSDVGLPTGGQKVADTALNGAQVTALVAIVESVAAGKLPRESAVALIESAFLVETAEAEKILGSAGKGFVPKDLLAESAAKSNEPSPGKDKKEFAKVFDHPAGDYHKKVNFKSILTKLNDYDDSISSEAKPIIKKMMLDLADQIDRKKILSSQNSERIDTISLKYKKELKQVLKASFMQLFKDAQTQAAAELNKVEFRKPINSEKFLELIEDETFKFVGDYEYTILKRVRTELIAAIKDGRPLSTVMDVLDADLNELSDTQIERFARTKHTEVMNNARVEFFESTGVVAAYQYSAVLDDRTSDICAGLHGKIFKAGSEPIPPMHFNCRSLLVPITKYEEFKPTETIRGQSVTDFIDENKGKGFSVK